MSKKDFSQDTNNVFASFFSSPTVTEEDKNIMPEEVKREETKKNIKTKSKKEIKDNKKEKEAVKTAEETIITSQTKSNIEADTIVNSQEKAPKTHSKENRYNFFVDNELNEYLSNVTWLRRQKNVAMYMNSLIKRDLLDFLNLPAEATDEELTNAWNSYKKENNI